MSLTGDEAPKDTVPVLLLKTKSTPGDAYEDVFSEPQHNISFRPSFLPVLEHSFEQDGMDRFRSLLKAKMIGNHSGAAYGGLIFTSQRAVEAFTELVQDGQSGDDQWPYLQDVPVYSVGPATTRALGAVPQDPPLRVFGGHTGNGENLAHFILEHYGAFYSDRSSGKPALLFLVGAQRRDIIPKTLMNPQLPEDKKIEVEEIVLYGTGVLNSFPEDFRKSLHETQEKKMVWIVVFSPTGCDAMLRGLAMLDQVTGKAKPKDPDRTRFIATIGPTTRDYMRKTFNFEPDVCAEKPSPESVLEGIKQFSSRLESS